MPMEYLKVIFPEERGVKIDGRHREDWKTNLTLEREAGTHSVTLLSPPDFTPPSHIIDLQNTSVIKPLEITFAKISPGPDEPTPGPVAAPKALTSIRAEKTTRPPKAPKAAKTARAAKRSRRARSKGGRRG